LRQNLCGDDGNKNAGRSLHFFISVANASPGVSAPLVAVYPVHAGVDHGADEFARIGRLHQVTIGAKLIALHDVALVVRGRKHHHRDMRRGDVGFDDLEKVMAAHQRQVQVKQYQTRMQVLAGGKAVV